jgi:hypothetical protein
VRAVSEYSCFGWGLGVGLCDGTQRSDGDWAAAGYSMPRACSDGEEGACGTGEGGDVGRLRVGSCGGVIEGGVIEGGGEDDIMVGDSLHEAGGNPKEARWSGRL